MTDPTFVVSVDAQLTEAWPMQRFVGNPVKYPDEQDGDEPLCSAGSVMLTCPSFKTMRDIDVFDITQNDVIADCQVRRPVIASLQKLPYMITSFGHLDLRTIIALVSSISLSGVKLDDRANATDRVTKLKETADSSVAWMPNSMPVTIAGVSGICAIPAAMIVYQAKYIASLKQATICVDSYPDTDMERRGLSCAVPLTLYVAWSHESGMPKDVMEKTQGFVKLIVCALCLKLRGSDRRRLIALARTLEALIVSFPYGLIDMGEDDDPNLLDSTIFKDYIPQTEAFFNLFRHVFRRLETKLKRLYVPVWQSVMRELVALLMSWHVATDTECSLTDEHFVLLRSASGSRPAYDLANIVTVFDEFIADVKPVKFGPTYAPKNLCYDGAYDRPLFVRVLPYSTEFASSLVPTWKSDEFYTKYGYMLPRSTWHVMTLNLGAVAEQQPDYNAVAAFHTPSDKKKRLEMHPEVSPPVWFRLIQAESTRWSYNIVIG